MQGGNLSHFVGHGPITGSPRTGTFSFRRGPLRVNRVILNADPSLLVFPDKQTSSGTVGMSQTCQQETHAPQQTASLFDHFVGKSNQLIRHGKSEGLGGF
jgi:hypothetical protein